MARYKKKHRSGGGSRGTSGWGGTIMIIFGCVAMLVCLIMFTIAIGQLDEALTDAATYSYMTSLDDVMGIFGLVTFLAFMVLGLGAIGGGAYLNIKSRMGGSWMDLLMLAVMGGITIVIALIMNGIILAQLDTAYGTANVTTNVADFVGLLDVMAVFGMVIFLTLMAGGLSQVGGAGFGAYKRVKG